MASSNYYNLIYPDRFGPNIENFLDKALPKAKERFALALGTSHRDYEFPQLLQDKWDYLSKKSGHNVGTVGIEMTLSTNVLLWAYKDKRLPVSPGNEAHYLEKMLEYLAVADFGAHVIELARLSRTVIDKGGKVIAFDARYLWTEQLKQSSPYLKDFRSQISEDQRKHIRSDFVGFEHHLKYVNRNTRNRDEEVGVRLAQLAMTEIQDLLTEYPEYQTRLRRLEQIARTARRHGLPEDAQSAAVVAENANPSKNIITISGAGHVYGYNHNSGKYQGTFAEHLRLKGFNVTPAIIFSESEIERQIIEKSPSGPFYHYYTNFCSSRSPMNLLMPLQDIVLDVSNLGEISKRSTASSVDQAAVVAKQLLESGTKLICDQAKLPSIADCAKRESLGKGSCPPLKH